MTSPHRGRVSELDTRRRDATMRGPTIFAIGKCENGERSEEPDGRAAANIGSHRERLQPDEIGRRNARLFLQIRQIGRRNCERRTRCGKENRCPGVLPARRRRFDLRPLTRCRIARHCGHHLRRHGAVVSPVTPATRRQVGFLAVDKNRQRSKCKEHDEEDREAAPHLLISMLADGER